MKKLVYGVGVNDLGYRVHVREWVTENGGLAKTEARDRTTCGSYRV